MNLIEKIKKKTVFHSYIFHGSEEMFLLFIEYFQNILTEEYSKKILLDIFIDEQDCFLYSAKFNYYKYYFFSNKHSLSFYNKILKTVEEPPYPLVFFFLSSEKIPETLFSRSLEIFTSSFSIKNTLEQQIREISKDYIESLKNPSDFLSHLQKYTNEKVYNSDHYNLQYFFSSVKK